MPPFISIVIPSLNKVRFIGKTLDSVLAQDYPNFEVIIMDGGSGDGTLEVIRKYARKYPKIIRYESKKDKGQWDAINKGFEKAKGEILAYLNADDVYEKGAFRKVVQAYRKNPDALWFAGRGKVINEEGKEIASWSTRYKNLLLAINRYSLLLMVNYLMQPSVFITRKAWQKFGPFLGTGRIILEYDLWLKIGQSQMPKVIDGSLAGFRLTKDNLSSSSYLQILPQEFQLLRKYTSNPFILAIHRFHNFARMVVVRLV